MIELAKKARVIDVRMPSNPEERKTVQCAAQANDQFLNTKKDFPDSIEKVYS